MSAQTQLSFNLSKEEALVLFEFLHRTNQTGRVDLFEDQAEQRVLWDLECLLEKQLPELLQPDCLALIAAARNQVRGGE